ncbi:hypothetical protein EAKF1_ch2798 [Escherichia albertii KF1]|nr:hypothetical protein EAKF1_ch2798 [Escherichia albertii KF1]
MSAFDVFNPTSKAGCGMVEKQLQALAVELVPVCRRSSLTWLRFVKSVL